MSDGSSGQLPLRQAVAARTRGSLLSGPAQLAAAVMEHGMQRIGPAHTPALAPGSFLNLMPSLPCPHPPCHPCSYQDEKPFVSAKKVLGDLGAPYSDSVELASFHTGEG